ncbi:hypothetical protein [Mycobacterium sp.]|uniref:sunset domain-containing protein n=1 Tax=Mycobacterium sp. TaxID=1785 RepID=UPI002C94537A|nr:hypothetical protein [Mycobacterium sp.]HTQ20400.1 hypothetical protein [Mycobacterium sp.]
MNGQRGQLNKLVGRALVSLAVTVLAAVLLTPVAVGSPIGDAEAAMMAAWDKAGGDSSPLGARKGDVYPVADGFVLDFAGGKMYFTPGTGANFIYGPILDKYESLGGPAGSDLGFPTITEVTGLAGPDSRMATFSASDKPVIYSTPDHGAFVVRGPINAAWDKLDSSSGVGVPIADETYDGDVVSQKFSGGAISWNRKTKQFTAEPATLNEKLKDFTVTPDPATAINMAWRAAGGAAGPLGAKKGGQYPIGGDGLAQDFAGGKVYFSPATGANALESDILARYELLGGPVGSELGFPVANESDGGIGNSSRVAVFSGPEKPVIFWTSDHGAFVIREAMKAAWDKLKGATGKLGAPIGDQAVDGDVVSQKFTGGKISWNRAKNTFTTDPPNLAPLLSGLQVAGQKQPSSAAMPAQPKKFTWNWWYLLAAIPLLVLLVLLVLVLTGWRRRRAARDTGFGYDAAGYEPEHDAEPGYDATAAEPWAHEDAEFAPEHHPDVHPAEEPASEAEVPTRISWPRGPAAAAVADEVAPTAVYSHDLLSEPEPGPEAGSEPDFEDLDFEEEQDNPDDVDTTSIPVLTDAGFPEDDTAAESDVVADVAPEAAVTDDAFAEAPADAGYSDDVFAEAPADAGYSDDVFAEAPADAVYSDDVFAEGPRDAVYSDDLFTEEVDSHSEFPEAPAAAAAAAAGILSGAQLAKGRHAALDTGPDEVENPVETAEVVAEAAPAAVPERVGGPPVALGQTQPARPTIHLPLDDPYQAPEGYPIKASARFGLYYTPSSALYDDTLPEIWLASEEVAEANGFIKAD